MAFEGAGAVVVGEAGGEIFSLADVELATAVFQDVNVEHLPISLSRDLAPEVGLAFPDISEALNALPLPRNDFWRPNSLVAERSAD